MKTPMDARERLVANLLREVERADQQSPPTDLGESPLTSHPSDEDLAVAALEGLAVPQWAGLMRHLAVCSHCRESYAQLLIAPLPPEPDPPPPFSVGPREQVGVWLAIAALVTTAACVMLLPLGAPSPSAHERMVYQQARHLLEGGRLAEAERLIAEAASQQIRSPRLNQLAARAALGTGGEAVVADVDRLTAFGFDAGGVGPRSAEPVEASVRVNAALAWLEGAEDSESLLLRADLLLRLGAIDPALATYRRALGHSAGAARAWNGVGEALFLQEQPVEAAAAFREAIRLGASSAAPHLNLALTLEELEDRGGARAAWTAFRDHPRATTADRRRATAALRLLTDPAPR